MKFCAFFLFLILVLVYSIKTSSATTCIYRFINSDYICELSNPVNDYEEITQINGNHLNDFGDDDVTIVRSIGGKMKIFNNILTNKFKYLIEIELNGFDIEEIRDDSLEHCERLEIFNLNFNKIVELSNGLFNNCQNLQKIHLNSNNIEFIPIDAIESLENLRELHLNHNKIANVNELLTRDDFFKEFLNVTSLDLSHNPIKSLPWRSLFLFSLLEDLNLANCEISYVDSAPFHSRTLKTPNLSNNKIESIRSVFYFLPSLQVVNLSSNLMTELFLAEFSALDSITHLDFSNNLISTINPPVKRLPNLEYLNLNSNNLTILKQNMMQYNEKVKLKEIHVKDNEIFAIEESFFELTPNLIVFDGTGNICVDERIENFKNHDGLRKCFRIYRNLIEPERTFWEKYWISFVAGANGLTISIVIFVIIFICCMKKRKNKEHIAVAQDY